MKQLITITLIFLLLSLGGCQTSNKQMDYTELIKVLTIASSVIILLIVIVSTLRINKCTVELGKLLDEAKADMKEELDKLEPKGNDFDIDSAHIEFDKTKGSDVR